MFTDTRRGLIIMQRPNESVQLTGIKMPCEKSDVEELHLGQKF